MSDEIPWNEGAFLRRKAREAIRGGVLPKRSPDRIWGGAGSAARCRICGLSIAGDQTELELEFVAEDRSKSAYYIVHLRCFSVFEMERKPFVSLPQDSCATL
jgi:hypothetical protein